MSKTKKATILVKLVSSLGTGFFYVRKKNPKTLPGKMAFVKYDPVANRHAVFTEKKLR